MKTVGCYEAKTHLSRLLDEVANGETITITKYGVPVAMIVPAEPQRHAPKVVIEEWRKYRQEHNSALGPGLTIREMIEEGRPR